MAEQGRKEKGLHVLILFPTEVVSPRRYSYKMAMAALPTLRLDADHEHKSKPWPYETLR
jgi:hypothetical protein